MSLLVGLEVARIGDCTAHVRALRAKTELTLTQDIAVDAAIRDGFSPLGFAHVVASEDLAVGARPDTDHLIGIARPAWNVPAIGDSEMLLEATPEGQDSMKAAVAARIVVEAEKVG